jgi:thiol:disulfide interchange protein DsbC
MLSDLKLIAILVKESEMKRVFIVVVLFLFFIVPIFACKGKPSPEEKFQKSYPDRKIESIAPTPVKGVYEIYTGNQLFYYAPDTDLLIYGNIVDKEGASLTRESYLKKIAPKMAQLPLDSALKIGNGKNVIVEFMDPDCFHCRESYNFFSKRNDVTVYVFFYPLSVNSEKKIKYILCSANQLKTYDEVVSGKLDNNMPFKVCTNTKVDEILTTHKKFAAQIGIRSTPFFYIKGKVVDGFTTQMFENLLKD